MGAGAGGLGGPVGAISVEKRGWVGRRGSLGERRRMVLKRVRDGGMQDRKE